METTQFTDTSANILNEQESGEPSAERVPQSEASKPEEVTEPVDKKTTLPLGGKALYAGGLGMGSRRTPSVYDVFG